MDQSHVGPDTLCGAWLRSILSGAVYVRDTAAAQSPEITVQFLETEKSDIGRYAHHQHTGESPRYFQTCPVM